MLLQTGELARHAGVTVRTLHHYEKIGLLLPSARSDAGYRLYSQRDVQRLYAIQALTRMGLRLAEVREMLESGMLSLGQVIDRQMTMLREQIDQAQRLHARLATLRSGLQTGDEPDLQTWLTTLEMMTMFDKWFSPDELTQLPFARQDPLRQQAWRDLVAEATEMLARDVAPEAPEAQALATRWMETLERDTAGDPAFLTRLNAMHHAEPEMQRQTGITPAILDFITRAFAESKLAIYQRYLTPEEFAWTRAHYFDRMMEWPPLVARLNEAVRNEASPQGEEGQAIAAAWLTLFSSFAGTDPRTQMKFRQAMAEEPHLSKGTWMTTPMLAWLQQAIGTLMQAHGPASR